MDGMKLELVQVYIKIGKSHLQHQWWTFPMYQQWLRITYKSIIVFFFFCKLCLLRCYKYGIKRNRGTMIIRWSAFFYGLNEITTMATRIQLKFQFSFISDLIL